MSMEPWSPLVVLGVCTQWELVTHYLEFGEEIYVSHTCFVVSVVVAIVAVM